MNFWIVPDLLWPDKTCYIFREDGCEVKVKIERLGRFVKFVPTNKSYLRMEEMIQIHTHYQMTEKIDLE